MINITNVKTQNNIKLLKIFIVEQRFSPDTKEMQSSRLLVSYLRLTIVLIILIVNIGIAYNKSRIIPKYIFFLINIILFKN